MLSSTGASTEVHRIAAVVLNYRTADLVLDCLNSLIDQLDPQQDVAVVVDNQSGDGSAEKIRLEIAARGWSHVRLVESGSNAGFSAGLNLGVRAVQAQAYLLLNSDTVIRSGAIETLWAALASDPSIGVVGPRLEWPDGTPQISCFRDHSPWSELIAGAATGPITTLLSRWDVPLPVRNEPFSPPWLSFAAVLIRQTVFRTADLLDEGFFMYFEDAEYCHRARRKGWIVWHEPAARVVHLRGRSSPVKALTAARRRRPPYYYASRRRYFEKIHGRGGGLAANLLWTLGFAVAWAREKLGDRPSPAVERELRDNWVG